MYSDYSVRSKRIEVLPLGKIRESYGVIKTTVERLLESDIVSGEVSNSSPIELMRFAADTKEALKEFIGVSEQLANKFIDVAATQEAQEIRKERFQIRREVREIVKLINVILQKNNCDVISNVDTASVTEEGINPATSDNAEDGFPFHTSASAGDRLTDQIASGNEWPRVSGGTGKVVTFKELLSPRQVSILPGSQEQMGDSSTSNVPPRTKLESHVASQGPPLNTQSFVGKPTKDNDDVGDQLGPPAAVQALKIPTSVNVHPLVTDPGKMCGAIGDLLKPRSTARTFQTKYSVEMRPPVSQSGGVIGDRLWAHDPAVTVKARPYVLPDIRGVDSSQRTQVPPGYNSGYDRSLYNFDSIPGRSSDRFHRRGGPPAEGFPVPDRMMDAASQHLMKQELLRKSDEPFCGEPHKFKSWAMFLESRMRGVNLEAIDIIAILSANTTGEPHKLVERYKSVLGDNPQDTLNSLWEGLALRFGSSIQICTSLSKKLDDFPVIQPPAVKTKLSDLTDLCTLIELNMAGNPELCIFDVSTGQQRVWSRLPGWLQQKWRTVGHEFMSRHGNMIPPFSSLVAFLQKQTDEMNNPYFISTFGIENRTPRERSSNVYKVEAEDTVNQNYCTYHKKTGHTIYDCKIFNKLAHHEKINFARQEGLCFNCLNGHFSSACDTDIKCEVCSKGHCTAMHYKRPANNDHRDEDYHTVADAPRIDTSLCTALCGNPRSSKSCSKTLLCDVFHPDNPDNVLRCYVILDEQSTSSFLDPKAVRLLNVSGTQHDYRVSTLEGHKTKHTSEVISGLTIRGAGMSTTYSLPSLYTNTFIPDCRNEVATPEIVTAHSHISHLSRHFLSFDKDAEVLFLVGRDGNELMHTKCFGDTYPFAHRTPVGWALVGSTCVDGVGSSDSGAFSDQEHYIVNKCFVKGISYPPLRHCFEEYPNDDENGPSQDDQLFTKKIARSVHVNDRGNIAMSLPFKDPSVDLPNNQQAVFCRTRNTLGRLKSDPSVLEQCLVTMRENILRGHVEEVPLAEINTAPGKAWWLPIFVVLSKNKKPRLVFDSSAKYKGISLNDVLLQGPDDCNRLRGVLMRFRDGEVGYCADIESMFYNFFLLPQDKDYLRFHWFRNNDPTANLIQYRGCVHLFGNRPSPAIAQYGLSFAVSNSPKNDAKPSKEFILHNFYVDDALAASRTVQEAVETLGGAREILGSYNIRLHKISSNKEGLLKCFPDSELQEPSISVDLGGALVHRTLGLSWNIGKDELCVLVDLPTRPFTKRGLLSVLGSIYDPLGMYNPVTNMGKSILREIMLRDKSGEGQKYDWDEDLPGEYVDRWRGWIDSLSSLDQLRLPRSYVPDDFGKIVTRELHVFCDASEKAIGAVAYLRLVDTDGQIGVSYVLSKSKLIPRAAT